MSRLRTPVVRIAGSFVSWMLFAFSFVGFVQATGAVIGLGGYCASGGPYAIATECPQAVVIFAPIGLFGMLIAVGIGLFFARSFGTPLFLWAWPVFFVVVGIQFLWGVTAGAGIVSSILIGLLAIVMGAAPWWWMIRDGAQPFLIGMADLHGRRFAYQSHRKPAKRSVWAPRPDEGEQVPVRPADWLLALGIVVVAFPLGSWLALLAFNAVGAPA